MGQVSSLFSSLAGKARMDGEQNGEKKKISLCLTVGLFLFII